MGALRNEREKNPSSRHQGNPGLVRMEPVLIQNNPHSPHAKIRIKCIEERNGDKEVFTPPVVGRRTKIFLDLVSGIVSEKKINKSKKNGYDR